MDLNVVWGAIFRVFSCVVIIVLVFGAYILGWYSAHHHSSRDETQNTECIDRQGGTGQ
jgi:hypothetical protein